MRGSRPSTQTLLLDTNVFISAIKNPLTETETLRLVLKILQDPTLQLVGNQIQAEEKVRYAEELHSETAATLLQALLSKTRIVTVRKNLITVCQSYIEASEKADIINAATCLQTDATLITNDHHYDQIRDQQIIPVWSTSKAIQTLLPKKEE